MTERGAHSVSMGPFNRLVRDAIDAAGMSPADAARKTGMSTQQISNIITGKNSYANRPPTQETLDQLARIPGLSVAELSRAAAQSMGMPLGRAVEQKGTRVRLSAHNTLDEFSDRELSGVLQILRTLRELIKHDR